MESPLLDAAKQSNSTDILPPRPAGRVWSINPRSDEEVMTMFEEWIVNHDKVYNSLEEKEKRFQIFKDSLRYTDEHNAENHSYWLGLNQFSDLTHEEFRATYLMKWKPKDLLDEDQDQLSCSYVRDELPESVDGGRKVVVLESKNQGGCGN